MDAGNAFTEPLQRAFAKDAKGKEAAGDRPPSFSFWHDPLADLMKRGAIYFAWCQAVNQRVEAGDEDFVWNALRWLIKFYPMYPLSAPYKLLDRLVLFSVVHSIQAWTQSSSVRVMASSAMELQSPTDFVKTLTAKVPHWKEVVRLREQQGGAENLVMLPASRPERNDVLRMVGYLSQVATRSAAYLALLNELMAFLVPASNARAGDGDGDGDNGAGAGVEGQQDTEEKAVVLLEILNDSLRLYPPSGPVLRVMGRHLSGGAFDEVDGFEILEALAQARDTVQALISEAQQGGREGIPVPAYAHGADPAAFRLKLLEQEGAEDGPREAGLSTVMQLGRRSVHRPFTARYHRPAMNRKDPQALVASIGDIWMQVDPVANRVIPQSGAGDTMEEILTSITPGTLLLHNSTLSWVGTDRTTGTQGVALSIKLSDITLFTTGRIGASETFYLSVHTLEVFKFFPFYEGEIEQLSLAVSDLTGKEPYEELDYVEYLLNRKLEVARMQILRQLASMPNPWIDHTDDLAVTIDYLTAENKPESHFDMERLFHSCRLNEEVTKETRKTLQSIWKDAVTEQVRLKILAIFDRLMDRAIFNVGDSHFHSMLMWFRHIEKTLDPYKNAAAINMLQRIVSKADEIKRQGLAPIPLNHMHEAFDYLEEFDDYLDKYR